MDAAERRRIFERLAVAGGVLAALAFAGFFAFWLVCDEGIEEAAYRTLGSFTTASLVDTPDTSGERAIGAGLSIVGGLFYLVFIGSVVQTVVVRNAFAAEYRSWRAIRKIRKKMRDHYIVCGFGRAVVKALCTDRQNVVVVEANEENRAAAEEAGATVIVGDADSDDVLRHAGVKRQQPWWRASETPRIIYTSRFRHVGSQLTRGTI